MRKHSNIRSALSLLLTFIMIFSQSGVTTLAREIQSDSFPDVSVTEEAIDIINDADVIAEVQEPDVALNNESGELTMDIVTGDTDALIGEGYANLSVPEIQGTIDLGTSIYDGDVTIAVPVEGTNRQYVHTFEYDFTSVNGVKAASFSNDDVEGTVWMDEQGNVSPLNAEDEIFLHYIDSQKTRVYSYDDESVTVRAEVTDPESIPDNAELVVTPIISGDAYNAYLTKAAANNSEKAIYESWAPTIEKITGVNDPDKLAWMTQLAHNTAKLNEDALAVAQGAMKGLVAARQAHAISDEEFKRQAKIVDDQVSLERLIHADRSRNGTLEVMVPDAESVKELRKNIKELVKDSGICKKSIADIQKELKSEKKLVSKLASLSQKTRETKLAEQAKKAAEKRLTTPTL